MTPARARRSWAVLTENRGKGDSDWTALQSYQASGGRREKVRSTRYGNADTSKQEVALADARGSRWKLAGGESCLLALFAIFTELSLDSFFKLLSNLYGN